MLEAGFCVFIGVLSMLVVAEHLMALESHQIAAWWYGGAITGSLIVLWLMVRVRF